MNSQPRRRQAGANALERGQRAFALRLPQRQRHRVLGSQRIGQRGRRAMADAGAAVEPAQALFTGRPAKANQRKQRPERQQREQADTDDPRHEGQRQPQPGPGHRQEQPDDGQQPRQMRPGALPGDRIFGPLQRLLQLQASDGIALARWFRRIRIGAVQ